MQCRWRLWKNEGRFSAGDSVPPSKTAVHSVQMRGARSAQNNIRRRSFAFLWWFVGWFCSVSADWRRCPSPVQILIIILVLKWQQGDGLENVKRNILKKYSDLDYDSFVGLMGRRNAGELLSTSCVCEIQLEMTKKYVIILLYLNFLFGNSSIYSCHFLIILCSVEPDAVPSPQKSECASKKERKKEVSSDPD